MIKIDDWYVRAEYTELPTGDDLTISVLENLLTLFMENLKTGNRYII